MPPFKKVMPLATVRVVKGDGFMVINASDLDEKKHKLYVEPSQDDSDGSDGEADAKKKAEAAAEAKKKAAAKKEAEAKKKAEAKPRRRAAGSSEQ